MDMASTAAMDMVMRMNDIMPNRTSATILLPTVVTTMIFLFLLGGCTAGSDSDSRFASARQRPTVSFPEFERRIMQSGVFSGGPDAQFEDVGRRTFADCVTHGLMPDHKFLDIGAGCLRIGWWVLQYIEPRNYHAIETVKNRLDTGADILGVDIHRYYNSDWEFPDVKFDFVLARSIWSHASKPMISKMLSEFAENSSPDGRFLTSFIAAPTERDDYKGTEWVGKVEKTDAGGGVRHSLDWIVDECSKNRLGVRSVGNLYGQTWLLIEHLSKQ